MQGLNIICKYARLTVNKLFEIESQEIVSITSIGGRDHRDDVNIYRTKVLLHKVVFQP